MNFQDTSKSLMDAVAKILVPATTEEVEVSAAETTEEVVLTEAIKVKTHKGMYSIKKGEESLKSWVEKIVIMSDDVKKSQRKTITQNIVKAIESGKIKNADLTQGLGALIGVKSPKGMEAPSAIVKAELKSLGLLESVDLEEASNADLKKVLATTRKLGAIVKGNTADFGQGAVIDFSIEKGKIKFDGGLSSGVEYYNNAKDAISALMIGVDEATDLEEAIVYRDIRHAIELLRTTPGATKFRDSLMKKDQDAKISSSDLKKAKEIFANMSTIDSANVEKKRKDRYFPRFGVKALEEMSEGQTGNVIATAAAAFAANAVKNTVKGRLTRSGRAERLTKKADSADKKAEDLAKIKRAKERLKAQKAKAKEEKEKAQARKAKARERKRQESTDLEEAKIPSSNISKFSSPQAAKRAASKQKYKTQIFMGDDGTFWVPSTNKEGGQLKKAGYEVYESADLEEAKRMKYDKVIKKLKDGEWDTSMDVKQRMHLTYTDNNTGKKKVVFVEANDLEEAATWKSEGHYTADGKEWTGDQHEVDGQVMTGKVHTDDSVNLYHFKELSPEVRKQVAASFE